jgi:hypothetical protein
LQSYYPNAVDFPRLDLDFILVLASPTRFTDFVDGTISKPKLFRGTEHLLNDLCKTNARIIYLSSSAVFNDYSLAKAESSPALPTTDYGKYKLFCEELLLNLTSNSRILRLTKVLDPHTGILCNFVTALNLRKFIYPFSDVFISPLTGSFVAASIHDCMRIRESTQRIFHCSGDRMISYHALAQSLFKMNDLVLDSMSGQKRIIFNPIIPQLASSCEVSYIQPLEEVISELSMTIHGYLRRNT